MAQLVKNPPAMRETWVQYVGWEDPLEKGKANPLQYSGLEKSMNCVHGVAKSWTRLSDFHFTSRCTVDPTWAYSSYVATTLNPLINICPFLLPLLITTVLLSASMYGT